MLNRTLEPGRQSWTLEETHEISGHRVRVVVKRDSYDFQSSIHVDVFSPAALQWNVVKSLAGTAHGDLPGGYTLAHSKDRGTEAQDRRTIIDACQPLVGQLLSYAAVVLDGVPA